MGAVEFREMRAFFLFFQQFSVVEKEHSACPRIHLSVMSYLNDGGSLVIIQFAQQFNNFILSFCVQVACGFISQNYGGIIC
jgi:hypothetical protein